jgi:hypothetical protein
MAGVVVLARASSAASRDGTRGSSASRAGSWPPAGPAQRLPDVAAEVLDHEPPDPRPGVDDGEVDSASNMIAKWSRVGRARAQAVGSRSPTMNRLFDVYGRTSGFQRPMSEVSFQSLEVASSALWIS